MHWLAALLMILLAYLIGALPFGFLVARWRGLNIFEHGSGNIGATNVGRVLGRKFGALVFVLDFAKGALPVALALLLKPHFDEEYWRRGFVEVAAGLMAFLGHLFPIYLRFHGGKGVATGAGAVAVLMPTPMLAALFVWLIVVSATRYVSLASILAASALAAAQLAQSAAWDWFEPRTWFCLVAGVLIVVRHRANLGRLLAGNENQLKENPLMHLVSKSLHVLALGLWFGSAIFFSFVVAPSLFNTFETLAQQEKQPSWFERAPMYREVTAEINGPKEQGTRAAGYAVGPLFGWYFALQGLCGFVALATALPWMKLAPPARIHTWRVYLLLTAVLLVLIGWPIEHHVSGLRLPRNQAMEAYLHEPSNTAKLSALQEARTEFGRWHLVSLLLNFLVIGCVTGAMALAGQLPNESAVAAPSMKPDTEAMPRTG